jgi:simple sugar transport system ATP-binding protein
MRRGEMVRTVPIREVTQREISEMMVGGRYTEKLGKEKARPGEALLRVRDLVYVNRFGKNVVDDVSFSVRAGEILGVAGVEGNGQTELVQMIFGMIRPASGRIEAMGRDAGKLSIKALRDLGVSYVPADRMTLGLAKTMSIEDNLIATKLDDRRLYRGGLLSRRSIRRLSGGLVDEFRVVCASPATEIEMLSGGNMQKVVVAREFTQDAQLFVVEQPSRGIDVGAAKFVHEKLIELRDKGCAILLISADLDELFKLSDGIAVMHEGKISAYFPDAAEVSEQELGHYMLGVKCQTPEEIGRVCHDSP